MQRPKKSELSGWQLSTRKNFPDEVRKSSLRQKKACKSFLRRKKYIELQFDVQIITILWCHNHTTRLSKKC